MKTNRSTITCVCLASVLGFAGIASAGHIQATPGQIEFNALSQTVIVQLSRDGKPLPAAEMGTVKLMIEDHDYDHMINVRRTDGALLITPTEHLQTGTYTLFVGAPEHRIEIPMTAPLATIPSSLELLAASKGISIQEAKIQMGLVTSSPRHEVRFDLPEQYYLGQELRINMLAPPSRNYEWHVNGVKVATGSGSHTFRYTFFNEGTYQIAYTESMNGEIVSQEALFTKAVAEPAVDWKVAANQDLELSAPKGFAQTAWLVDDILVSAAPNLTVNFDKQGTHTVECLATTPAQYGSPGEFRKITYHLAVTKPAGP